MLQDHHSSLYLSSSSSHYLPTSDVHTVLDLEVLTISRAWLTDVGVNCVSVSVQKPTDAATVGNRNTMLLRSLKMHIKLVQGRYCSDTDQSREAANKAGGHLQQTVVLQRILQGSEKAGHRHTTCEEAHTEWQRLIHSHEYTERPTDHNVRRKCAKCSMKGHFKVTG